MFLIFVLLIPSRILSIFLVSVVIVLPRRKDPKRC